MHQNNFHVGITGVMMTYFWPRTHLPLCTHSYTHNKFTDLQAPFRKYKVQEFAHA